jgi:hypothetical protein
MAVPAAEIANETDIDLQRGRFFPPQGEPVTGDGFAERSGRTHAEQGLNGAFRPAVHAKDILSGPLMTKAFPPPCASGIRFL